MWTSSYGLLERVSPAYRQFLEGLTVAMAQTSYEQSCRDKQIELYTQPRGSPRNAGRALAATHPMVRTNPVTGWKGLFGIGGDFKKVNELLPDESRRLQDWLLQLVVENHDLQLRHQWRSPYDIGEQPRGPRLAAADRQTFPFLLPALTTRPLTTGGALLTGCRSHLGQPSRVSQRHPRPRRPRHAHGPPRRRRGRACLFSTARAS